MLKRDTKEIDRHTFYSDLYKALQNKDYEKGYRLSGRLFHEDPTDSTAFQCKIGCLINNGKFTEALEQLDKNKKISGHLQYERAYCYYRQQKILMAKEVLDGWKDNSFRKKELMTQIHYRIDHFEDAYDMMKELIKTSDDDMEEERQTNLSAITASLKVSGSEKEVAEVEGNTYEMKYNYATGLIGEGKIEEAEKLLLEVEKLALETLQEDEAPEEDIADEVGLVTAQRAYCAQIQGREKEALATYSRVLKSKPTDGGLIAVASNNIVCINKDQNIFDSKKRIKTFFVEGVLHKLNRIQRRSLLLNQCLFNFHTQQYDACKELCDQLDDKFPENAEESMLIRAALIAKTEGIAASKKMSESYVAKNPESALTIKLGLVQQVLKEGKRDDAIALLKDLGTDFYRPGVISSLVTLYQAQNDSIQAAKIMKEAVDYYRKSGVNKDNMNMMWRQMASLMMEQGDPAEAAKSLEELRRSEPNDPVTLAQLIVAYAQYDIVKAKNLSNRLPSLAQPEIDIGVLESPNWLANVKSLKKAGKPDSVVSSPVIAAGEPKTPGREKEKRKKKKKAKVPANFDPNRTPDPERWLPRFERSGYRPKKSRKGRVDVGKGTQGADSVTSAIYDMSGKIGQKGSPAQDETSSPVTPAWRKDKSKKKSRSRK